LVDTDSGFMREALAEGRKALPACLPNPPVGCVLVRDGRVIARGFTQPPYRNHAEAMALSHLAGSAADVCAYVTLEPCSFQGRTPSCAHALVAVGIQRVVVGIHDPDPRNNGAGVRVLLNAGVEVISGVLAADAHRDLDPYLGLPANRHSPWLDIPLADYEGHMSSPGIGQADILATQFAALLREWAPASAAVIGCAGGNGFDRIDAGVTQRVVGIDINPQYIRELAYRYAATLPGLELYVRDIQEPVARIEPVELIYAALVLEYVDPEPVLRNLRTLCRPNGILATVLQLPPDRAATVSDSSFASMKSLAPAMRLVSPDVLTATAAQAGFTRLAARRIALPGGKEFVAQVFKRTADDRSG
jgi:pyrimidine deaminase RibD-like protein